MVFNPPVAKDAKVCVRFVDYDGSSVEQVQRILASGPS
jgi:hypothetical protein